MMWHAILTPDFSLVQQRSVPQTVSQSAGDISEKNSQRLPTYNNNVCAAWEAVKDTADEKVFEKKLFDRIALVISNDPSDLQPHELLNAEEQEYLPVFEKLVNVEKVKHELALSRQITQRAKYQAKGVQQIEQIHSSVRMHIF